MALVTNYRTGELLRRLTSIIATHSDGMQAKDALAALANAVVLTDHEKGFYSPGVRRFEKIVRFATVDLVKAGWLAKNKGQWTVTDLGRRAYDHFESPEEYYREASRLYRRWKASQPVAEREDESPSSSAPLQREVVLTFEAAEEQAWDEVSNYLRAMPPYQFQDFIAALLRAMNYHVSWVAPPGQDGGVDIIAHSDPLGTRPPRIKVQVKRRADKVAVDELRSFMALLGENDVGIFVSTGGFTKDAADEARIQEKRTITLIDLERLFDLWVEHYQTLTEDARQYLPLKAVWFLDPSSV